jgi:ribosomal protein L21E
MLNPRVGQQVRVHYRAAVADRMPYHGKIGTVVIAGKGKPRNHLIDIEGTRVAIPCGNLNKVKDD